ncbi:MAG TPA: YceI family protein [Acidimicrobiales bacterium]|nr:YceI family protein [Acidimicrobiales bacterium]
MATAAAELTRVVDGEIVPAPGTYTLDKAHSIVAFVARHLMVTKVRGTFSEFEGTVVVAEDPSESSVQATIRTDSVSTGEPQRDGHLRSGDFFEQDKYPTMTFKSRTVRPARDGRWLVTGDLTIKDVTRSVSLELEFNGATSDPWGGVRLGFSASTEIDRTEFGVSWNSALEGGGVVVGNRVRVEIEAEAILAA